jgi:hypothetical protein
MQRTPHMTNGTQLWPGDRMRAFFRAHIRRETSLNDAEAERLANALTAAVNRMLVWNADVSEAGPPPAAAAPAAPRAAFNPFQFSALVALAKSGRDGLLKRLADIRSADELKTFAEAQHLAIDGSLKKPDELRKAIVAATEQRLADRKAAAS